MDPRVRKRLENLRGSGDVHRQLGMKVLDGSQYLQDFLVAAVLNRSLALISGFSLLIEKRNFIAAAPLLRLQLDNCLRLAAAGLAPDPDAFVLEVLKGTRISRLKDREGEPFSDRRLVDLLSSEEPWIKDVYKQTSGYIHLSEKHIFNAVSPTSNERRLELKISEEDRFIEPENYLEAVDAFLECTRLLLRIVGSWTFEKEQRAEQTSPTDVPPSTEPL